MNRNNKRLGTCQYCFEKGTRANLARVTTVEGHVLRYCPRCLDKGLKELNSEYEVDYPYKEEDSVGRAD